MAWPKRCSWCSPRPTASPPYVKYLLMSPQEVAQAHFRTFNSSWDYTTDPEHTLADISLTKVKKFISRVNKGRTVKIKDAPLKALEKLDLVRGKRISRACYLLFLKRESLFTAVELGRFQTPTLIKDGDRTKSDLFTQVDAVFKAYGLAAPEFAEVGNSFLVTVYKERISGLVQIPGKGVVEKVPEKAGEKVLEKVPERVTVNQGKIGPDKGGHWEVLAL